MEAFEIADVVAQRAESGDLYLEFLRTQSLSCGVYVLAAGSSDPQSPHDEEEVYYVLSGRGKVTVDGEERVVQLGSVVFVGAGVDHKFHDIDAELQLLVFFAPPEGSASKSS